MKLRHLRHLPAANILAPLALLLASALQPFSPSAFSASAAPAADAEIIFTDNFDQLPAGILMGIVGAEAEYHYVREVAPTAGWATQTFRSEIEWQRCWRGIEQDGHRAVGQFMTNKKGAEWHPMLTAYADGATLWKDYTVQVRFIPKTANLMTGFTFRYETSRTNYVLCVKNGKALIKLVHDALKLHEPNEKILAETPFPYEAGSVINATVQLNGPNITATLQIESPANLQLQSFTTATSAAGAAAPTVNRKPVSSASDSLPTVNSSSPSPAAVTLTATDATLPAGKISLLSDGPATYTNVKVLMTPEQKASWLADKKAHDDEELALQAANPTPVLWKKINISGYGVGRNIRFGDLLGNGQKQILLAQVQHLGPKDTNAEISCLTAIDLDGKILWQNGAPDPWHTHLTDDVAFQIHDIDGDGKNEVIYTMNRRLIVADGATGKEKYSIPTPDHFPQSPKQQQNRWFPNILGDAIYFCDLRGTGRKADIILKDRYTSIWAYDDHLNLLWSGQCITGHYPIAADVDGDGHDELLAGYTLWNHDGKKLWTLDDKFNQSSHDDGVAIARMKPTDTDYTLFMTCSDDGVTIANTKGDILRHYYLGHVQNPGVANFLPDQPGLQVITANFWGNQGILHFFDSDGNLYHTMEPTAHGSACLPVNWSGRRGEYVMLSANYEDGGLFDGHGRRVVRLPCDGHPDMAYHALDLTGDSRDELVVWDDCELWIYTQSDNGKLDNTKLYNPTRDYLDNDSNYRSYISYPPGYPIKIDNAVLSKNHE